MKGSLNGLLMGLSLIGATAMGSDKPAHAQLFGSWQLQKFTVVNEAGEQKDFCRDAHGFIFYLEDGYMAVTINCPFEPAKMVFYSAKYEVKGNDIIHHVTNSTNVKTIGTDLTRSMDRLSAKELFLSGQLAGDTFRIEWLRAK